MRKRAAAGGGRLGRMPIAIAALVFVGASAAFLYIDSGRGARLWSRMSGAADEVPAAPLALPASAAAPVRASAPAPAEAGSRMMIVADAPVSAPAPASAPVAPSAASPAAAAKPGTDNSWIRHISGSLPAVAISGPASSRSAASASAKAAPGAAPAPSSPAPGVAASPAGPVRAAPTYVHYGESARSDIMSSAAGPVYNFTGDRR